MDPDLLLILKALSDPSRLRIVGLLAGGKRMSVTALASALDLTPGTVVHHLKRLREAGLVEAHARPPYVEYELELGRLAALGAALDQLGREAEPPADELVGPDGQSLSREDAKVIRAFFSDGRLETIPAQERKRLVVLRHIADTTFEPARRYPEKEVNMMLALLNRDVASLRRYLVDYGFMEREAGVYRLRPRESWPASVV